jgi:hypothetical protein
MNNPKKINKILSNDEELLELVKIAGEVVLREDNNLLKELAKH